MDILEVDLALALRAFDLELALGVGEETVAVVGPSGAGKTTLLRAIAGLARPDRGRIAVGGRTWFDARAGVDVEPERRSVGMLFQDHALFPHMTAAANVAFARGTDPTAALTRFGVEHLAGVRPAQLSGGERQRVALARAMAREPAVLLLDEPTASLDAHTRADVRGELRELLDTLRLPTIVVTHDFEDAATVADRVAVLVEGRLVQVGTPGELVAEPADAFVATFTGSNVMEGRARGAVNGLTRIELKDGTVVFSSDERQGAVGVIVHPWEIRLSRSATEDSALNTVRASIAGIAPVGSRLRVRVGALTAEVTAQSAERLELREGDPVVASFKATATRLVPLTGAREPGQPIPFAPGTDR